MRKQFTPQERATFTLGATVQVRVGRHWHPAEVTGAPVVTGGWAELPVKVTGGTHKGEQWGASPTAVRTPA